MTVRERSRTGLRGRRFNMPGESGISSCMDQSIWFTMLWILDRWREGEGRRRESEGERERELERERERGGGEFTYMSWDFCTTMDLL